MFMPFDAAAMVNMDNMQAEIDRLRRDLGLLSLYLSGATPDRNTQTPDEVEKIEAAVQVLVAKYNPFNPSRDSE